MLLSHDMSVFINSNGRHTLHACLVSHQPLAESGTRRSPYMHHCFVVVGVHFDCDTSSWHARDAGRLESQGRLVKVCAAVNC
jgi:hypothetical protein